MPDHFITLAEARELTSAYKSLKNTILNPVYVTRDILPNCETFDRAALDSVLSQQDCTRVRIYYGMDANMVVHTIIVGVDANGDDLVPNDPNAPNQQIIEQGERCPTNCPQHPL